MCVGVRVREAVAVLEALELRDGAHVRVLVLEREEEGVAVENAVRELLTVALEVWMRVVVSDGVRV